METRTRRLVIVGIAAGLILFGPGAWHLVRLSVQQHRLDRQLADLETRDEALRQEEARLGSDPTYVEGLIRTTFKWAKPDEYVIPLEQDPRR